MPGTRKNATDPSLPLEELSPKASLKTSDDVQNSLGDDEIENLVDRVIELVADNDMALKYLRDSAELRMAQRQEWKPQAEQPIEAMSAGDRSISDRTGGAMQANSSQVTGRRRPFLGFDVERQSFARLKEALLQDSEGQFVVFVGDEMLGPFESHREAESAGYKKFGLGPLFIQQLLTDEEAVRISRLIAP